MALTIYLINTTTFDANHFIGADVPMKSLGLAIMGTDRYNYILPFEVMSILLLACTVGAILIARKK